MMFRTTLFTAVAALAAAAALPAAAQDNWPSRAVTIIVPNNPGSGVDLGARILAEIWAKEFGQPFVVENVPGAANTVGAAKAAASAPDGYTFLHASLSSIALVPLTRNDLTYKPEDLTPVAQTMDSSNTLVVNPQKMPFDSFEALLVELKANPGKYNYSSSGVGGLSHLIHELIMARTGIQITHIPYGGSSEATAALVAGEVDLAVISTTPILPFLQDGKLKALAVAQPQRIPELPDVPSIHEIVPEYEGVGNWNGIFAPKGTDPAIIDKLSAATVAYLATPEGKEAMAKVGAQAAGKPAAEFQKIVTDTIETWRGVIADAGLAPK
jgi:tripartite-type tricarboxylate transporter receptor subunit TctC